MKEIYLGLAVALAVALAGCDYHEDADAASPDAAVTGDTDAAVDPPGDGPSGCPRIIGGHTDTDPIDAAVGAIVGRQFNGPWQVGCSGTLIAPDTVLTAGHCVSQQIIGNRQLGFALGTDLTTVPASAVHVEATRIPHPNFSPQSLANGLSNTTYDIALLKLAQPITDVAPAKVVRASDASLVHDASTVRIVGYGVTSNNGNDIGTMRTATTLLGTVIDGEMIVGVPGMPQKCNGDSGGPTFLDVEDTCTTVPRVIGLTSRAQDQQANCDKPGIDTRVSYHLDWLATQVDFGCDSGTNTTACP